MKLQWLICRTGSSWSTPCNWVKDEAKSEKVQGKLKCKYAAKSKADLRFWLTMAVASGGARGAVASPVQKSPLKNNRNQNTYLNILGSFRYGVVWLPLKNHYLGQVRTWNGFQKWHFRASKYKKVRLPPAHKFLATAMLTSSLHLVGSHLYSTSLLITPDNSTRTSCSWVLKYQFQLVKVDALSCIRVHRYWGTSFHKNVM